MQFPLDQPIPHDLIERIVKFRVEENNEKEVRTGRKKEAITRSAHERRLASSSGADMQPGET